ncbi:lipoprotein signal peptidase [Tepiditoga spiralis]|uniref:Lipoprotein signal peptidase n=1 Tax=Tepiditoga spiralis TaxID=2108365 RepID=A0A7G1G9U4_9BACT|nr:signal peptidase II [Tepiditoga spiralis]BBE30872.1 lipoprotein signal peptidase [Tepiditoga spiralis]
MTWIIPISIFLDQISKIWSRDFLSLNPINIWFIKLTYAQNTGMAFGMFKNNAFLLGIFSTSAICIALLFREWYLKKEKSKLFDLGINMVIGGALGNMYDRIRIGYVVDMVYVPHFAIFNVADSFVTIGGIILAIYFLWRSKHD